MKKNPWWYLIAVAVASVISCRQDRPDWMDDHYHITSPDGDAFIYRSIHEVDNNYQTSLATWIIVSPAQGGCGVFDVKGPSPAVIDFQWTSDSTVLISYDPTLEIIQQENECYFYGRIIKFTYQARN